MCYNAGLFRGTDWSRCATTITMIDLYLQAFANRPLKYSPLRHRTWFCLKHQRFNLICALSQNSPQMGYHANCVPHSILEQHNQSEWQKHYFDKFEGG